MRTRICVDLIRWSGRNKGRGSFREPRHLESHRAEHRVRLYWVLDISGRRIVRNSGKLAEMTMPVQHHTNHARLRLRGLIRGDGPERLRHKWRQTFPVLGADRSFG